MMEQIFVKKTAVRLTRRENCLKKVAVGVKKEMWAFLKKGQVN